MWYRFDSSVVMTIITVQQSMLESVSFWMGWSENSRSGLLSDTRNVMTDILLRHRSKSL